MRKINNFNILLYSGFILCVLIFMIIISGLFLAMHYKPDFELAFDSVNNTIMNEAPLGWLWRKIHGVGSTLAFLLLYIHMFSMIYLGFYKGAKRAFWYTGMVLYFAFMVVCFTGYVLPMGQMSYWAVQVITTLLEYIPGAGEDILIWVRGDFAVSEITLIRFYVIHIFLMPLVLIVVLLFHADFFKWFSTHLFKFDRKGLHVAKAQRYAKTGLHVEYKPFFSNSVLKPMLACSLFLILFFFVVFFHEYISFDKLNYIPADTNDTPALIYPEWYFLWMLQLLKSFFFDVWFIKGSYIGMASLVVVNFGLLFLPLLDTNPHKLSAHKRRYFFWWFWLLIISLIVLSVLGKLPVSDVTLWIGFVFSLILVSLFVLLPFISKNEVQ